MSQFSRRRFLSAGAALSLTGAGALALPRRARSQDANSTIRVGIVGVGWRGGQLLDEIRPLPGVEITGLCDADAARSAEAAKKLPKAKVYDDMRRMFDDDSIDAVVIATCNHWHCLAALWAVEAGKDVYVEKPMSHRLWEGRQLIAAVKKHNRIVQVGTQQRSDPLQDEVKDYLHGQRALGKIESVVIPRFGIRESIGKGDAPLNPPATLNYNMWLGPAEDEPIFRTNEFHYSWHWVWNTGDGECGNWGVHLLDDVVNVVLRDEHKLPDRACAGGGRLVWNDAGETPNFQVAFLEAGGTPILFALSNLPSAPGEKTPLRYDGVETGYVVHGEGGVYHGSRGRGTALDKDGKVMREFRGDSGGGHLANFFEAVRSRNPATLNAPVEVGHSSAGWAHVINAAYRSAVAQDQNLDPPESAAHTVGYDELRPLMGGQLAAHGVSGESQFRSSAMLEIDVAAEQFTGPGAEGANIFLDKPPYRGEFVIPQQT
ncbi:MAG TPA: Gfo/Idh/MocA family oxidoreductase [Lacipirellulaceae bacterium]|nr:Gfo/Idh/MocA family oxidoreductase [Lacipirellulaceae bacterium]